MSKIAYLQQRLQESENRQQGNTDEKIVAYLTIYPGGDQVDVLKVPIVEKSYTIGSSVGSAIFIRGVGVSSFHALLQVEKGFHFLEDLESTNGTYFGILGKKDSCKLIPKRMYQVLDGQIITFGPTRCRYEYVLDGPPPNTSKPPIASLSTPTIDGDLLRRDEVVIPSSNLGLHEDQNDETASIASCALEAPLEPITSQVLDAAVPEPTMSVEPIEFASPVLESRPDDESVVSPKALEQQEDDTSTMTSKHRTTKRGSGKAEVQEGLANEPTKPSTAHGTSPVTAGLETDAGGKIGAEVGSTKKIKNPSVPKLAPVRRQGVRAKRASKETTVPVPEAAAQPVAQNLSEKDPLVESNAPSKLTRLSLKNIEFSSDDEPSNPETGLTNLPVEKESGEEIAENPVDKTAVAPPAKKNDTEPATTGRGRGKKQSAQATQAEHDEPKAAPRPSKRRASKSKSDSQGPLRDLDNFSTTRKRANRGNSNSLKVLLSGEKTLIQSWEKVWLVRLTHQAIKKLGADITTDWRQANLLVAEKVKRTVKLLCCISTGKPIVSRDWIEASQTNGAFVGGLAGSLTPPDPMEYLLLDEEGEKKFSFSLRDSLALSRSAGYQSPFENLTFYATLEVKPSAEEMKEVLDAAGARLIYEEPHEKSQKVYVIGHPDDWKECQALKARGFTIYNNDLILTGILQQRFEPKEHKLVL
ncbi:Mediator of DNA damage checkpoint protein 1 [Kappamyces sp. JEL0829]|nr:Mediator of DNA damage checkpoint protein 1 [Kappamyces sp. JEL0829]